MTTLFNTLKICDNLEEKGINKSIFTDGGGWRYIAGLDFNEEGKIISSFVDLRVSTDKKQLIQSYIPKSKILETRIKEKTPLLRIITPNLYRIKEAIEKRDKRYFDSLEYSSFQKDLRCLVRVPDPKSLYFSQRKSNYLLFAIPPLGPFLTPTVLKSFKEEREYLMDGATNEESQLRKSLNYLEEKIKIEFGE